MAASPRGRDKRRDPDSIIGFSHPIELIKQAQTVLVQKLPRQYLKIEK